MLQDWCPFPTAKGSFRPFLEVFFPFLFGNIFFFRIFVTYNDLFTNNKKHETL